MASSVYSRALQKALELAGGHAQLCRLLHVPAVELQKWIDDKAVPPRAIFLKTVDFILDETAAGTGSDVAEPPAPRECATGEDSTAWR